MEERGALLSPQPWWRGNILNHYQINKLFRKRKEKTNNHHYSPFSSTLLEGNCSPNRPQSFPLKIEQIVFIIIIISAGVTSSNPDHPDHPNHLDHPEHLDHHDQPDQYHNGVE